VKPIDLGERELEWLDISINVKKSSCMRTGPRFNVHCSCTTILAMAGKYYGEIR